MTSNNVKLLNEINHNFTTILEKYSENHKVLDKINSYVNVELVNQFDKIYRDVENIEKIEKEKNYFINKFLSSMDNIFYYVKQNDVFIHYDMKHYKIYDEDILINKIYKEITENHQSLHPSKFDILQEIINELKQQLLEKCLPESITIQNIIKYLMTYFFDSKDDAKYFCCVIGDIILNKKTTSNICINKNLSYFINVFNSIIDKGLSCLSSSLIDKFLCNTIVKSTELSNHRILKSNNENQEYLWGDFLKHHAIDLLCVCIHYSRRYINSENYLNHHKSPKTILYLKNNTINAIIEEFCLKNLSINKQSSISYENMEYLWHMFICKHYIPDNIITDSELHYKIKWFIKYDHTNKFYISIFHKDIKTIEVLKNFVRNTLVVDINDELEISELIAIFEEYNKDYVVDETMMVSMVKYFTYCDFTSDDKIICNTRCNLWDKKGDLNKFINVMKEGALSNYPINNNLSINDIYTKYCKYTSNNGDVRKIVTKNYFVNYILHTVPEEFFVFNKVSKEFWSN
jgi:hypothetical protein